MIADIPVRHEGQRRTAVLALPPDATQQSEEREADGGPGRCPDLGVSPC